MKHSSNLDQLYSLRNTFSIIALTGRTGSGCSTIAEILEKGFDDAVYPSPDLFNSHHNSYRKYKIVYNYAKENFRPYTKITYREVEVLLLLRYDITDLIRYLGESRELHRSLVDLGVDNSSYENVIPKLESLSGEWRAYVALFESFHATSTTRKRGDRYAAREFVSAGFKAFSKQLHDLFSSESPIHHYVFFQRVTNNLRRCGEALNDNIANNDSYFVIADTINRLIKSIRRLNRYGPTHIVIDSLRNPLEIMYFRQRLAAFYTIAVNREDSQREDRLKNRYGSSSQYLLVKRLIDLEYKGGDQDEFHKQSVRECIEKADIHITYRNEKEAEELNRERKDKTSPYFSIHMQLLKYVSLISHPGLITPSPEERCMQLAYTAKYNSGCISRQVGAAITDEDYSVKAIGWNDPPAGQVPCLLRNADSILYPNGEDYDKRAFTPFELSNEEFVENLKKTYQVDRDSARRRLAGRNMCFCFKSVYNSYKEGKNQVHTRSLHAEESAFLQITKYGGTGIQNGKLFTTASPCELCSKKAYQLGVKVIYYVDPYPGISREHILEAGYNIPEIRLFSGAIGNAYHWLYEPLMAYKDEINLIFGIQMKDLSTKQAEEIVALKSRIADLENRLPNP